MVRLAWCAVGCFSIFGAALSLRPLAQEANDPNRVVIASVVGCLVDDGSSWRLTSATVPVESKFQLSSAVEVRDAESTALGDQTYKLLGVRFFKPEIYKGRKVFIKGAIVKSGRDVAVNVTSLQMVNVVCAK